MLADYRKKLGSVPALSRLEAFSKRRVGADLALYRELDGAMAELETQAGGRRLSGDRAEAFDVRIS